MVKTKKSLIERVDKNISKLIAKMINLEDGLEEVKQKVKYLPSTEVYLKSQDELMGKLDKIELETKLVGQHYEDTNNRVDFVDKYLGINSRVL